MHRAPNPAPDPSALHALLVAGSLVAFALFVGQFLFDPVVVQVLLGVTGAVLLAAGVVKLVRWTVSTALSRDLQDEDTCQSTVDAQPTD